MYHMRTRMPFIFSSRSAFVTTYLLKQADEGFIFVISCRGNHHILQQNMDLVGQDVIAEVPLFMVRVTPLVRPAFGHKHEVFGCKIEQVDRVNLNGKIPILKQKLYARKRGKKLIKIIRYVKERIRADGDDSTSIESNSNLNIFNSSKSMLQPSATSGLETNLQALTNSKNCSNRQVTTEGK